MAGSYGCVGLKRGISYTTEQSIRLEVSTGTDTLFYVRVLTYLNHVVEDLLTAVDYPYMENFAERYFGMLVAHVDINYQAPVALSETVDVSLTSTVQDSSTVFEATGPVDGRRCSGPARSGSR